MAIRVEKEGNNKQMLIFMNRMDLLRGSSGNNNLRRDVQKTGSNFVMWISEKIGCRNLNLWLHFINSNLMAVSICCGQPGYRQTGDYLGFPEQITLPDKQTRYEGWGRKIVPFEF